MRPLPADVIKWDGLRKGLAWGMLLEDGAQERHAEGGNRSPRGLHKGSRGNTGSALETEAQRAGKGRTEVASLTRQMAFPVKKSPAHSISSCTREVLPSLNLCSYNILQSLFSMRPTLPSWRWKGGSRGSALRIRRKSVKCTVV